MCSVLELVLKSSILCKNSLSPLFFLLCPFLLLLWSSWGCLLPFIEESATNQDKLVHTRGKTAVRKKSIILWKIVPALFLIWAQTEMCRWMLLQLASVYNMVITSISNMCVLELNPLRQWDEISNNSIEVLIMN